MIAKSQRSVWLSKRWLSNYLAATLKSLNFVVTTFQYCEYLGGSLAVIIDEHNQKAIELQSV